MKILIAEDDANTREALREVLDAEGFQVIAATNGLDALEFFRKERPDFVCLDVMMPGLNGYEVCKHIRKDDEQVAILFLTAKTEEIDTVLGLELGADDYMTKPFGVKEVLARIRAIMRRTGILGRRPGDIPFDMYGLTVIPGELRATRGAEEIQLSLRDVRLLRLLYHNKGSAVTRAQIGEEVWGKDFFPESRALDQHVSQLRKRIEPDPASPSIIRTVHGVGYRYEG